MYIYSTNIIEPDYKTINLSDTCSIDIPVSDDINNKTLGNNIVVLNDTKHNVMIGYYNTHNKTLSDYLSDGILIFNIFTVFTVFHKLYGFFKFIFIYFSFF